MKHQLNVTKNFGGILLPDSIIKLMPSMDAVQLKVFIYLCSINGKIADDAPSILGITQEEFELGLAFCRGTGLFELSDAPKSAVRHSGIQSYDSETLSNAIEQQSEFALLVGEIGRIIGKVLNKNDINMLYNLYDYEGVSCEYICAVANYAVRRSKGNMAYIVKTTLSIRDEGIENYGMLEEYISHRENKDKLTSKLWSFMGFGTRAPSAREKAFLTKWLDEYGMSEDLIKEAYNITVDALGTVKLSYMGKILDSWFENGYKTPSEAMASRPSKKPSAKDGNTSFDINELFTNAVKKGMEEQQ